MPTLRLENCYDSHVHWLATGGRAHRLKLHHLKSESEVRSLKPEPHHYRGEWLVGFGWDQNLWTPANFPHRKTLDALYPDHPVAFSRADGHATWVNTAALMRAGWLDAAGRVLSLPQFAGGQVVMDGQGLPTGVLLDAAKNVIDSLIPPPTGGQVRAELLQGAKRFNEAGITHIRDLTCDERQWNEACHLADANLLTVAVEQFFSVHDVSEFDRALSLAEAARKESRTLLRVKGIKVFMDGALGSEGALLSRPYASGSGRGLQLIANEDLKNMMSRSWTSGLDFAVHVIGDEAAHQVAQIAVGLWDEGRYGCLHLEHVEILRPETVDLLKGRDLICHLQPSHWLSDKVWLKGKVGPLFEHVFPWRILQEENIPFFFGSDSPIERPGIELIVNALRDSAENGVPPLLGSPYHYVSHPDPQWTPSTYTLWEAGRVKEVVFQGAHLWSAHEFGERDQTL